jgi:hypothetical protein
MSAAVATTNAVAAAPRAIVYRTHRAQHGPVTRLMSPGDLGQFLKPFVAWAAVSAGRLEAGGSSGDEAIGTGELAVFEESGAAIEFVGRGDDTAFVLGSAEQHPHELVMGHYSVHTSQAALAEGEAEIRRIGAQLREQGRLR